MTKVIILSVSIFYSISCFAQSGDTKSKSLKDLEIYIDQIIAVKNGITIEFPFLYDSLTSAIPDDGNESMIIAELLKSKGFTVTQWGRGNFPPLGPRIVTLTMRKENCKCIIT